MKSFELNPAVITMLGVLGVTADQIAALEPSTIEVCNIKRYRSHDERAFNNIYIGRPGSIKPGLWDAGLGNPHPMSPSKCDRCGREHTRKDCITEFGNDMHTDRPMQSAMWKMARHIVQRNEPVKLWCFCSPMPCHGDVIVSRLIKHLTHLEAV